jgi:hypothetical protein
MYCLTDQQIDYILNDIRRNGVDMEDLQLNLLDHVCCILEQTLEENDDFERFYHATIKQFYKHNLREIEEETINLLTFKHYYAMKKVMIASGALSAAAFIGGSFLKIIHAQGTSFMFLMGIVLLSFVFLPVFAVLKMKETTTARDRLIVIAGTLMGVLYALATMFAINQWPGRTYMWLATVCVSMFVFIPVYFFTGIRKPETKTNTIVTSVLLVGATCLLFSMIGLRPVSNQLQNKTTQQVADK